MQWPNFGYQVLLYHVVTEERSPCKLGRYVQRMDGAVQHVVFNVDATTTTYGPILHREFRTWASTTSLRCTCWLA